MKVEEKQDTEQKEARNGDQMEIQADKKGD